MICFVPLTPPLLLANCLIVNERSVFHSCSLNSMTRAFLLGVARIDRGSTRRAHKSVQSIESGAAVLFLLPMLHFNEKRFHLRRADVFSGVSHRFAPLNIAGLVLNFF